MGLRCRMHWHHRRSSEILLWGRKMCTTWACDSNRCLGHWWINVKHSWVLILWGVQWLLRKHIRRVSRRWRSRTLISLSDWSGSGSSSWSWSSRGGWALVLLQCWSPFLYTVSDGWLGRFCHHATSSTLQQSEKLRIKRSTYATQQTTQKQHSITLTPIKEIDIIQT